MEFQHAMNDKSAITRRSSSEVAEFNANWARWRCMIRDLPAIRRDKIEAVQRALRNQTYDGEAVVNETVRRLADEIGPSLELERTARRLRFYRLASECSR